MSDLTNVYAPSDRPLPVIDLKQRVEPFCKATAWRNWNCSDRLPGSRRTPEAISIC